MTNKEKQIEEMEHNLSLVMDYNEYSEDCGWGDQNYIDFEYNKMAKELIDMGWTKLVWHKVSEGDLPQKQGLYLCYVHIYTFDWHGNEIGGCGYSVEPFAGVFNSLNASVIAWTELPTYKR